uniref:Uncharacterized protein n=1 Tax=Panagrolaimus sp. JU765 TaxID=591449 RepID=A0AC34QIA5_9BILA
MIYLKILLLCSIFGLTKAGNFSNLITGCTSHCTLDFDKDLSCWNKTLVFYNQMLMGQLRQYILIQTHIGLWYEEHHQKHTDYNQSAQETINRMKKIEPGNIEDEDGIIEPMDYEKIVNKLILEVKKQRENHYTSGTYPPPVTCPLKCEHGWDPYFRLFIISAVFNVALAATSMVLVWFLDRRDTKAAKLELAECEVVKYAANTDKSGIGALKRKSVTT